MTYRIYFNNGNLRVVNADAIAIEERNYSFWREKKEGVAFIGYSDCLVLSAPFSSVMYVEKE